MPDKKVPIKPSKPPVDRVKIPGKPTSMPGETAPKMQIRDSLDKKREKEEKDG